MQVWLLLPGCDVFPGNDIMCKPMGEQELFNFCRTFNDCDFYWLFMFHVLRPAGLRLQDYAKYMWTVSHVWCLLASMFLVLPQKTVKISTLNTQSYHLNSHYLLQHWSMKSINDANTQDQADKTMLQIDFGVNNAFWTEGEAACWINTSKMF